MSRRKPNSKPSELPEIPGSELTPMTEKEKPFRKGGGAKPYGKLPSANTSGYKYPVTEPRLVRSPYGMVKLYSGFGSESYGYEDPFATNNPGLIILPDATIPDVGCNGNLGGTAITGSNMMDLFMNDLGTRLNSLAGAKGYSITGWNDSGTFNTSLLTFIQYYSAAYRLIQGLRAMTQFVGYNRATSAIGQTLINIRDQLDSRIALLSLYPFPQKFVDIINKVTGIFLPGALSAPPILSYCTANAGVGNNDLTNITNVNAIIAAFDGYITSIRGIAARDMANITRLFAFLYKTPPNLDVLSPKNSEQDYCMVLTRGMIHAQAVNVDCQPALTGAVAGNLIPFLVYGDPGKLDPQWLTFFRQSVCFSDTGVLPAATNPFGFFDLFTGTAGGNGTWMFTYGEDGTFRNMSTTSLVDAGAGAITLTDQPAFDTPWAAPAILGLGAGFLNTDQRSLPGFERYYIALTEVMGATIRMANDAFLV